MSDPSTAENNEENDQSNDTSVESNVAQIGDIAERRDTDNSVSALAATANMGLIMDIPVTLSMELGRTRLSIKELLSLNPGAVIELQRLANEPMEILVNGTLVAHGEAVKVGDRYGVRLTSVVNSADRLNQASG